MGQILLPGRSFSSCVNGGCLLFGQCVVRVHICVRVDSARVCKQFLWAGALKEHFQRTLTAFLTVALKPASSYLITGQWLHRKTHVVFFVVVVFVVALGTSLLEPETTEECMYRIE